MVKLRVLYGENTLWSGVLVAFFILTQPSERRKLQLKKSRTRMACGQIYREFDLLMIDVGEPSPTVGGALLGQVFLGYDSRLNKPWKAGSEQCSSMAPAPVSAFVFLP